MTSMVSSTSASLARPMQPTPIRAHYTRDDISQVRLHCAKSAQHNFKRGDDGLHNEAAESIRGECESCWGCASLLVDSFHRHILGVVDRLARGRWGKPPHPPALHLHR